ncbi:MAG TPA: hypothetical protein VN426_01290 [Syntrophomonadaceae bacterium]|nr:hypothetical protein [Syntrophomonadaceae bacterium]
MNEFPSESDQEESLREANPPDNPVKGHRVREILLGIGLSAAVYLLTMGAFSIGSSEIILGLMIICILAAAAMVNVKLFKSNHFSAAMLMLIFTSPFYLFGLIVGPCTLLSLTKIGI